MSACGEDALDVLAGLWENIDPHTFWVVGSCSLIAAIALLVCVYCLGRVHENAAWDKRENPFA